MTAFTDGCAGLRSILADAGVTTRPIADWFHIAMRLPHATLAASNLSTDEPRRKEAKATIVAEVERLRWRIWNGKAKNAQITFDRIRKVMHVYKGERIIEPEAWRPENRGTHCTGSTTISVTRAPGWSTTPLDTAPSLRVGTSVAEGAANFLVNRRMNKSQQMRWSRRGADLLLQVRCAAYNGTLGSGHGKLFEPVALAHTELAVAA